MAPHLEVQAGDILAELVGPYLAVLVVGPSLAVLVVVLQAVSTQVLLAGDTQAVGVELHLAVGSHPVGNRVQELPLAVVVGLQGRENSQELQILQQLKVLMVLHTQMEGPLLRA